jgi:hypothetical protein
MTNLKKLHKLYVIYPEDIDYSLTENIQVCGLENYLKETISLCTSQQDLYLLFVFYHYQVKNLIF